MAHQINISKVQEDQCPLFDRHFKRCVGTGRVDLALREDYMDNLRIVQSEIGFEMMRGHGLLSDQCGVYREVIQHAHQRTTFPAPIHNFNRVLKIIDNLLSVGIKPFLELGFMPGDLASGDQTVFWWKGNITPPKDDHLWTNLIADLMRTLLHHYGKQEVHQWLIEVWNEPDLVQFWKDADEAAYYHLYDMTARTIKEVDPLLKVGGPATCPSGDDWMPRFLNFCKEQNVPIDFASHHVYFANDPERDNEFHYMAIRDMDHAFERFKVAPDHVAAGPFPKLPVHITEWNTSYSPTCPVHDTAFNAAAVAWLLTRVGTVVDSYSYWTFCDIFEESDIPRAIFHGGFGLLTENGLRKPSFHAFAFANQLEGPILHRDDVSCITRRDDGSLAALLFTPNNRAQAGEGPSHDIHLKLPISQESVARIQRVDDQHGNAYETWKQLGRPRWPDRQEMAILEHAQWPHQELKVLSPGSGGGELTLSLPSNSCVLMEVFERRNQEPEYFGIRPDLQLPKE